MEEQRTTGSIAGPPLQPLSCSLLQRAVGFHVARPVTLAITPPRELAWWGFSAVVDYGANVVREPRVFDPVENDGRDSRLAGDGIAARFKIQRDCEAVIGLVSAGSC